MSAASWVCSIQSHGSAGLCFQFPTYFVKWFGSYDLALIPVALMLMIGALAWLRVDATEEIIPDRPVELLTKEAVPVLG